MEVGRVVGAWGVKGWFKVQSYSASPEALFSSRRWYLLPSSGGPQSFAGIRAFQISQVREHAGTVVARCDAVADRTAAEALRGCSVYVSRSDFPPTATDEYYWVDLIGLPVFNREGLELGHVRELVSAGPQTVLVLTSEEGGRTLERMIPFVAAYIDSVDLAGRRILVDWQPDF